MKRPEISIFKDKVAELLVNNPDIYEALGVPQGEDLLYKHIFPYHYFPTQEITNSLICFFVDCPRIHNNEYFKNSQLTFVALCPRGEPMRTKYGTRIDLIGSILLDMFCWNDNLRGFEMKLVSDIESNLNDKFYLRQLVFTNLNLNNLVDGNKSAYKS